jgi:glutathione synthase/RimK-type ligase-like ATP-grasp enzyme
LSNDAVTQGAGTTPERRIAFVTWRGLPHLSADDRLAAAALASRGAVVDPVVWDDGAADWSRYQAAVIRSTWDYHLRPTEFLAWIERIAVAGPRIWNPPELLRWNLDKRYLADLGQRGIPVVPTLAVKRGEPSTLTGVLEAAGWNQVVVKPAVSASAHQTWRTSTARAAVDSGRFSELVRTGDVLVQPFLDEIKQGEWSLCFFGGRFSHAVLKRPPEGEFRVQSELGGDVLVAHPEPVALARAAEILALVPAPWLYARVDGCMVRDDFMLMELELIEPTLFFHADPAAPDRFAEALQA